MKEHPKHSNQLIYEKSPYLLQHAHNPVDWLPWNKAAFKKAHKEDKPIFLSIGYSTCHWCHVMERESFENEEIAKIMNKNFVCIKVDREERPDVDHIYMDAVQRITGQGGWPMSLFLTPDAKPFFGGTYWPPVGRMGHPGFTDILLHINKLWKTQQHEALFEANKLTAKLGNQTQTNKSPSLDNVALNNTFEIFRRMYDSDFGGFGNAPKFPPTHTLSFLLRHFNKNGNVEALQMVENTLIHMANGGIYDHLGGGFHRYSVDEKWLAPHFEKMLYDQGLLVRSYLESYQVTGNDKYAEIARDTLNYVLRDMTSPAGGFYSAEDADTEGEEGRFYTWEKKEILKILGKEVSEHFCAYFNVTDNGNFEGRNILNIQDSLSGTAKIFKMELSLLEKELELAKTKLFEARRKRPRPLRDEKILTSWNGLMISALAMGGKILKNETFVKSAEKSANFILEKLQDNGRLLRRYCSGEAALLGYADDYAFFTMGLIDLFEATYDERWMKEALRLNKEMTDLFWDKINGSLLFTGHDGEKLIAEFKEIYDGATPSCNSVAALNYLRLGHYTGDEKLKDLGRQILRTYAKLMKVSGAAYPFLLSALDFAIGPNQEIVLGGERASQGIKRLHHCINSFFLPNKIVALRPEKSNKNLQKLLPFIKNKSSMDGKATAYVCSNYTCRQPVTEVKDLKRIIKGTR